MPFFHISVDSFYPVNYFFKSFIRKGFIKIFVNIYRGSPIESQPENFVYYCFSSTDRNDIDIENPVFLDNTGI